MSPTQKSPTTFVRYHLIHTLHALISEAKLQTDQRHDFLGPVILYNRVPDPDIEHLLSHTSICTKSRSESDVGMAVNITWREERPTHRTPAAAAR